MSVGEANISPDAVHMPDSSPKLTTYSDDDSDFSDGEGYLFPENDKTKKFIRLEVRPTTKPKIKQLFPNTDKVYKMSGKVRGRALVINNDSFIGNERNGSEVDTKNIVDVFKKFNMVVNDVLDLTAKEMLSEIRLETKNKDHDDYQLFVLVIMTHGTVNDLYGIDEEAVRLRDVLDLLSSQNFPRMAGKPKLIVIQACSGSREDFGDRVAQVPSSSTSVGQPPTQQVGHTDSLELDDLIVFMSTSPLAYRSPRHSQFGTLFIRCLVTTLYKHGCHRDVCELFKMVQERVRNLSMTLMKKDQIPMSFSTLTHYRKFYLFPGYDGESSD